jgi:hypothetical protein
MLYLEPLPSETYWNDNITVYRQISRYYFAYGHRFGLEFANSTFKFENGLNVNYLRFYINDHAYKIAFSYVQASDGSVISKFNVNRISLSIELNDLTLKRVYCLAPVWNTTEWVHHYADIEVQTGICTIHSANITVVRKNDFSEAL